MKARESEMRSALSALIGAMERCDSSDGDGYRILDVSGMCWNNYCYLGFKLEHVYIHRVKEVVGLCRNSSAKVSRFTSLLLRRTLFPDQVPYYRKHGTECFCELEVSAVACLFDLG